MIKVVYSDKWSGTSFIEEEESAKKWLLSNGCLEEKLDDYIDPWKGNVLRHDPLLVGLAEYMKATFPDEYKDVIIQEIEGDQYYVHIDGEGTETLILPDMMVKAKILPLTKDSILYDEKVKINRDPKQSLEDIELAINVLRDWIDEVESKTCFYDEIIGEREW